MNLDAVLAACERLPDLGITHRAHGDLHRRLGPGHRAAGPSDGPPVRLALSLHAADDALRSRAHAGQRPLPARRRARRLPAPGTSAKRRRVFVEYLMLAGVNDRYEQAVALAPAARPARVFKVNLIPYNPTDAAYEGSSRDADRRLQGRARGARRARHRAAHPRARHRRRLRPARRAGLGGVRRRKDPVRTDELPAVSFRPLRAEDIEELFLPGEWDIAREWLARQERDELYVAVAEVDGEALGRRCIDFTCSAEVGAAYCFAASVMEDQRSRGIGTALDRHFGEVALARGFHTLQCVSVKSNLRALAWHERLGYHRTGEELIRWQEPGGEREFDCWLMERPLGPG